MSADDDPVVPVSSPMVSHHVHHLHILTNNGIPLDVRLDPETFEEVPEEDRCPFELGTALPHVPPVVAIDIVSDLILEVVPVLAGYQGIV